MRGIVACLLALAVSLARADRILLVPIDSRPAAGQFAQMIARIAGEELRMPPYASLGRFTNPGSPEQILGWLEEQDLRQVDTLIVSADMICYGGLIASRADQTTEAVARQRLSRLIELRRRAPGMKLYVFSATMRLVPTATRAATPWRLMLARYEELKDRIHRLGVTGYKAAAESLRRKIPAGEIETYELTRDRNHALQRDLIALAGHDSINYLTIGQDDAKADGPQIPESEELRAEVERTGADRRVYFCEGIDQLASVLVSRAMLKLSNWTPRVRVVYSDPLGRRTYANYETEPIELSLRDQLLASGAEPIGPGDDFDYTLFVNTPHRRAGSFRDWMEELELDLDQGSPAAVADLNLAGDGTADAELFNALCEKSRLVRLLGFAGWNTAGNTLGTVIPAANVYLLARKVKANNLDRELAQREFLLHRFVDDYWYHKDTRPVAYSMILSVNHDEVYGADFFDLNDFVVRDLEKHLGILFRTQFQGQKFTCEGSEYEIASLQNIKVWLPWPRAYEVRLQFHLEAKLVSPSGPDLGKP